ncbi:MULTISPECIES: cell division protein FtsQ/DivIB [unclassified Modestobacter]|uniref:cell division protein FtsQ/DivIB n=1 Tax=unclassified Modestobacter TaxID=2643866 RepID=UPI0022AAEAD8|nr:MULTISPECIES: FtsQ-type POTRA domain-containing protein [unclassified Modestobacter]MCZ2824835.1 FtsQ-type POTRA domain-containing protein [Modestobacter sp. VKM Ac-2981]MCZ2854662.1 FtsQ-type POTRA domain-containing protein [Modestobacter sp. VKM Ac-2982]
MSRTGSTTRDRSRRPRRGAAPAGAAAPVTSLGSRRGRSRRTRSPRRRLVVVAVGLALVVALGAWVLLASPLLAVRTVRVDGAVALSDAQVVSVAGIEEGTPLVRVDTGAAAGRVAQLPQVASVEVTRGWPGTVVVTLAERIPVAVVDQAGTRQLLDAGGVVFDTITGDAPSGVVPLDVRDPGPDDAATTAALGALTALPDAVRSQVTQVSARTADDVTLTLTDGRSVRWGSAERTDRKAEVLDALLDQIEQGTLDPAGTLDVSTPDAVVLR